MVKKYFLTFLVLMVIAVPIFANSVLSLDNKEKTFSIGKEVSYLEDFSGKLSIQDVNSKKYSQNFQKSNSDVLNFGYSRSVYWIRFTLKNRIKNEKWFLKIPYALLDDIHFYVSIENKGVLEKRGGRYYPFSKKEIKNRSFSFSLPKSHGKDMLCFLRIQSKDSLVVPLYIISEKNIYHSDHNEQLILGLYYGLVLIMIIYNLLIFFSIRNSNYIYYLYYVATLIVLHLFFQLGLNGLLFEYIGDSLWWSRTSIAFFISMGMVFSGLFCVKFLSTSKLLNKVLIVIIGWAVVEVILSFTINYYYAVQSAVLMSMIAGIVMTLAGFISLIRGNRAARIYLLSWLPIIFGGITYGLKVWGFIPSNFFTEYSFQMSSAMQAALLSLAMGDSINLLRKEHIKSQEQLLEEEKRARKAQEEFSNKLEGIVEERTSELKNILVKLEKQDKIMQSEMNLAADIQRGILPKTPVSFNGINITAYYDSLEKIGGDFYDIFPMKDGYFCVVMADVSGHGIPAAFITAMAKISFHEATIHSKFPQDIFREVNKQLVDLINTQDYLTAFILVISPSYEVFYANASHCLPVVYKKENDFFEKWDTDGLFLGAIDESSMLYNDKQDLLEFGDRLVLFTDGLIEARNIDGEEFGTERVKNIIRETSKIDISESQKKIVEAWKVFTKGAEIKDDVSILVLEIDPKYKKLVEFKNSGLDYLYHNNFTQAIDAFKKAIEVDAKNADLQNLIGKTYYKNKNYSMATKYLTLYLGTKREDADAWCLLASSQFNTKKFIASERSSFEASQIRPNYKKALEIRGMSLVRLERYEDALPFLEQLLEIDPQNVPIVSEVQLIREMLANGE